MPVLMPTTGERAGRLPLMLGATIGPGAGLAKLLAAAATLGYPVAERGLGLFTKGVPAGMRFLQMAPRNLIAQIIPSQKINPEALWESTGAGGGLESLFVSLLEKAAAAKAIGGPAGQRSAAAARTAMDLITQVVQHALAANPAVRERGFNWLGRPSEMLRVLRMMARR